MVRQTAVELKRALFDKELMYIYHDYLERLGDAVPVGMNGDAAGEQRGEGQAARSATPEAGRA